MRIDEGFDVVKDEQGTYMRPALQDSLLEFDTGGILPRVKLVEAGQAVVEAVGKGLIDDALIAGIETGEGFERDGEHAVIVVPANALSGGARHRSLADAAKSMQA